MSMSAEFKALHKQIEELEAEVAEKDKVWEAIIEVLADDLASFKNQYHHEDTTGDYEAEMATAKAKEATK